MGKLEELEASPETALPDPALNEPEAPTRARTLAVDLGAHGETTLPRTGALALMTAVLEEAIRSCFSTTPQVRAEAEAWLSSGQRRSIFSYLVICETLGLEADATRRAIRRLIGAGASGKPVRRTRSHLRHHALSSGGVGRRGVNRTRR
jgi:hypothetical protein